MGVEIGGTKLQIVLGTAEGGILERVRFEVDPARGAVAIRGHIERTLGSWRGTGALASIGVGFGGPVDWRTGQVSCSHHVEGWSDFPLGEWLRERCGLPVRIDNDANVGALAESRLGAGRGATPVFYVTLGSGVGGGLVCDGQIYHGAKPGEAEIGHLRLDRSGSTVESLCAGWAVDRRIRELKREQPHGLLARLVGQDTSGEARHLRAAFDRGDEAAGKILRETAADLAFGLSHVIHLFHPDVIVLGGGLSLLGEPLREAVCAALPPFLMAAFQPGPAVRLARLGEDAVPIGALLLGGATVASSSGQLPAEQDK